MDVQMQRDRDYRFVIGLVTGAFVGAGLALWLTPRSASELGERMTGTAKRFGQQATERVGKAVGELTRKGQVVRDDVAETVARGAHEVEQAARQVARGAHEVERYATAAKSETSPRAL